jgi:hypothetical protein
MNGTDGSTTLTDSSSASNTFSANGNVEISTDQFKFGGSSAYFDGNGDYLKNTNSDIGAFGTDDFTIESWIYVPSSHLGTWLCTKRSTTGWKVAIGTNNNIELYSEAGGTGAAGVIVLSPNNSISLNTWTHVAFVRSGTTVTGYINGTSFDTNSSAGYNFTESQFLVGIQEYSNGTLNEPFAGYVDEVRITKGVARYTSNFTPQSREFYPSTAVGDITSNNEDLLRNADLVTTQPKHYSFNGTSNYLYKEYDANLNPSNITSIAWVYLDNWSQSFTDGYALIINTHKGGNGYALSVKSTTNVLSFQIWTSAGWKEATYNTSNISSGWHQIAATADGTSIKLFVDADEVASVSAGNIVYTTTSSEFNIGRYQNSNGSYDAYWPGDIAIVKVYDTALT